MMHVESENNPVSCEASHAARIAYHRFEPEGVPVDVCYSQFTGASGVSEYELCLTPLDHGPTSQQLSWLEAAYHQVIDALRLKLDTGICRRFFCSDPHNQQPDLCAFAFSNPQHNDPPCAVSWTGQPPVPPAKVSMWAQHVFDPSGLNIQCDDHSLTLDRGALTHHWSTNLIGIRKHSSFDQTQCIFDDYEAFLDKHQMNLADHVMRTWFYVRHVDVNYKGLVVARRELFEKRGLTADTHYIASTGIEGNPPHDRAKVAMDAYAVGGIMPQQVKYVQALDHLGPTHAYGVTFERATALSFADRQHIYISGTASIDPQGNIVHEGNVSKQFDRAMQNIDALLSQCGAGLSDMAAYYAYVRDPSDQALIRDLFNARLVDVPVAVVVAPVCRPGWLVEIEGRAIVRADNPQLPAF